MLKVHRPRVYRSSQGCCICRAKSSSSRFTDSNRYEQFFQACFHILEPRHGEICNACVLLVKRFQKLPPDTTKDWRHVVDVKQANAAKAAAGRGQPTTNVINSDQSVKRSSANKFSKHRYKGRPFASTPPQGDFPGARLPAHLLASASPLPASSPDACASPLALGLSASPVPLFLEDLSCQPTSAEMQGRSSSKSGLKAPQGTVASQGMAASQGMVGSHGIVALQGTVAPEGMVAWTAAPSTQADDEDDSSTGDDISDAETEGGHVQSEDSRSPTNVSSLIDLKIWRQERVCCGLIFRGPHGAIMIDQRHWRPCSKRKQKIRSDEQMNVQLRNQIYQTKTESQKLSRFVGDQLVSEESRILQVLLPDAPLPPTPTLTPTPASSAPHSGNISPVEAQTHAF